LFQIAKLNVIIDGNLLINLKADILYSDGKVTLIKGDKVVQLTIGSNVMVINGVAVNMDVAAELSNDRTMLPFRWVAQALGAKVTWDEATQTVTMEL
jgi:Copper amine oxidase N-terminal domain.